MPNSGQIPFILPKLFKYLSKIREYVDSLRLKPGFLLDRNLIVKSCDSSKFWFIVERLVTIENKNFTQIGLDLQPKRFL